MSNISKTDWARIDAMKDEDINTSDIPPLSEDFLAKAQLRMPKSPITVEVEVDSETFAWFQAQGESAQQQMSVALKIYVQANKAFPSSTRHNTIAKSTII
ncbi:MAG: BrnA antitoxin family protein [Moorea sp. SIO2B7]|nr:BrnA antitoxin family protein [Moorena sp. SIO2B7]